MQLTKEQRIEKERLFNLGQKQCPKCPEPRPISEFSNDKSSKDGLYALCKEHIKEYSNRPENKEAQAKRDKKYQEENKQKISINKKKYYEDNKEKIEKRDKKRYTLKRHQILKQKQEYTFKNKEKISTRIRNRKKQDINFRLRANLASRVAMALKGLNKSLSTMFLIGCEIDYLMYYLQEQFTKGMSWDNYGLYGWHMDHIKPCVLFDLSKKSQQLICFNHTNLQPLWAEDNLRKGNKYKDK